MTWLTVILIILAVLVVAFGALTFFGNKLKKKQDAQQEQINESKQVVSMLVIDKKKMKLKEANLPKIVLESTPRYLRGAKVPIVKAKVGPKIMTLIADEKIFAQIPIKAEMKAEVSGMYIVGIKSVRGGKPVVEVKLKGFKALTAKFKRKK